MTGRQMGIVGLAAGVVVVAMVVAMTATDGSGKRRTVEKDDVIWIPTGSGPVHWSDQRYSLR